jgi:uncharacterized membrane protein YvbJ
MFCPECGSENPDDASFCGACGEKFDVVNERVEQEPQPVMRFVDLRETEAPVPSGLKYGVLAASLFIPLIGIVMGLYYLIKGESEQKKGTGRLWLYVGVGLAFLYMLLGSGGY